MSFASSVLAFGGAELMEGEPPRRHAPLRNLTEIDLTSVVALFRHPEERLLSTYWYIHQHRQFCCEPIEFGYTGAQHAVLLKHASRATPPHLALTGPLNFTGCQAKMVLGHRCFEKPRAFQNRSWQSVADEAIARIDRFKFVGVVSEFFLSLCLFNYKMTGARYVTPFQVKQCNPTYLNLTKIGMTAEQAHNVSSLPYDHLDHAVFEHAQRRFWADVSASGVSLETCVANLTQKTYGCQSWPRYLRSMRHDHARFVADIRNLSGACVGGGVCYVRHGGEAVE